MTEAENKAKCLTKIKPETDFINITSVIYKNKEQLYLRYTQTKRDFLSVLFTSSLTCKVKKKDTCVFLHTFLECIYLSSVSSLERFIFLQTVMQIGTSAGSTVNSEDL